MQDYTNKEMMNISRQYYDFKSATEDDFEDDYKRFKHIKKLITRYKEGELRERLIINHLIVLFNVFNPTFLKNDLLPYHFKDVDWFIINTFLIFLKRSMDMVSVDSELYHIIKKHMQYI